MKQKGNKPPDNKQTPEPIAQDLTPQLLKASALERARMVIDHRESKSWGYTVGLTEEEFTAVEESLLRTEREEKIYRRARLLQKESNELVLFTMYHSSKVLDYIERLRALRARREHLESLTWITEQLGKISLITTGPEQKATGREINILRTRIEKQIKDPADIDVWHRGVLTELAQDLSILRALLIAIRRLLKVYKMPIRAHLKNIKDNEQYVNEELKSIYKQGIATPQEVETIDPEPTAQKIIESRIRYIGN